MLKYVLGTIYLKTLSLSRSLSVYMHMHMYEHILSISGVNETSFRELLSQTQTVTSLCLRDTHLNDEILHCFSGSSLEMLDVSDTMVRDQIYGN